MSEPTTAASAASSAPQDRRALWTALLIAGTFFMENLDGTVIATALPQMAQSFGKAPVDLNIGMSAYLITLAVFIPISGWIADRFGARKVFASAVAVFTLASVFCGLAQSLSGFVAMRILQGIGGAMMVPVGRLVVLNTTQKDKLISAIATLTWPALVAPVLGPPLGGFITDHASWRWIFWLNLPLGVIALGFTFVLIPSTRPQQRTPFDLPGFVAGGTGLASLMYALELISRPDAGLLQIASFLIVGATLLAFAVTHFRRTAHPMIDLHGLRLPTFAVTVWGGSLFRMAIGAVPFLLPLMFQLGFGLDAFHAGLLTLAVFAGNLAMKPATTPILRRWGFKRVMIVNGLINAVALFACATFTAQTHAAWIVIVLFIGGMCRSMQFTALNTIAFADVEPARMSGANTLFSTVMQLTMGMGIAAGAIAVRAGQWLGERFGTQVPAAEFRIAFLLIGLLALGAIIDCLRLAPDAGENVSRRRPLKT